MNMKDELPEVRCPHCIKMGFDSRKLLYKGEVMRIQIKCPRCKSYIYYEILDLQQAIKKHVNRNRSPHSFNK